VELGQREGFLYHGPAFRPTAAGQPLKLRTELRKQDFNGPYINFSTNVHKYFYQN